MRKTGSDIGFVKPHQYRTPRQIINYDALAKIIKQRRGNISRKKLMEAISQ
jgi:hypothetical protein